MTHSTDDDETEILPDAPVTIFSDEKIFELLQRTEYGTWKPNAAVIVIEHRTCSCGTTHDVPSGPFAEYRRTQSSSKGKFTQTRLTPPEDLPPLITLSQLPRRTIHVNTTVDRCQFCFTMDYDGTEIYIQLHMFPQDPRTYVTPKRFEAEVNGAENLAVIAKSYTSSTKGKKSKRKSTAFVPSPTKLSDF